MPKDGCRRPLFLSPEPKANAHRRPHIGMTDLRTAAMDSTP